MWPVIGALAGVLLTGLVTWLVARRTNSGRVDQSPATDLWSSMRSELARLQSRVSEVEGRLATAEADLNVSQREVLALQAEAAGLRQFVRTLEAKLLAEEEAHRAAHG